VALVVTAATDDCAPTAAAVALTVMAADVDTARSLRLQVMTLPLIAHAAPADDALPGVKPAASR
jgi:hypothetical protein